MPGATALVPPDVEHSGYSLFHHSSPQPLPTLRSSALEALWAALLVSSLTGNVAVQYVNGASAAWQLRSCTAAVGAVDAACNAYQLLQRTRTWRGHLYEVADHQSLPGLLTVTTDYTAQR